MGVHELTRSDARRVAVRAQLLAEPRPTDLMETVRHLTVLQDDPTEAVARNADLARRVGRRQRRVPPRHLRAAADGRPAPRLRAPRHHRRALAAERLERRPQRPDAGRGDGGRVGDVGEPAVVEGVRGKWRVDPAYLDGESR